MQWTEPLVCCHTNRKMLRYTQELQVGINTAVLLKCQEKDFVVQKIAIKLFKQNQFNKNKLSYMGR